MSAKTQDSSLAPFPAPKRHCVCTLSLWTQELEVMQEIVELQEAAENYEIEPEEQFRTWFRTLEQLSEKER